MRLDSIRFPLVLACLAGLANAQSNGTWSALANSSTSSLHSGAPGGTHENVVVTNAVAPPSPGGDVTLTIVHFVLNSSGDYVETTEVMIIPYGSKRSFYGDVKSVVVTAGAYNAQGTFTITFP